MQPLTTLQYSDPIQIGQTRVTSCCGTLVWETRDELDLLETYTALRERSAPPSPSHKTWQRD